MTRDAADAARLVSFPAPLRENQYQRRLYEALAGHGFELTDGHFKVRWLVRNRRRVRVLHFHWPADHWRHGGRLPRLGTLAKFALFGLRLAAARALGYRLAWTIHEVYPLDRGRGRLDRRGGRMLASACQVLIANDEQTATTAHAELGRAAAGVAVVPHASYSGDYPAGRSRADVRAELGIPDDAVTFLLFGHISVYKRVEWFVEGFRRANLENAALVVAGHVMHEPSAEAVRTAAREDARIKPVLDFIPDERVAELFEACDAAISPRQDGGTSGVLILALSMGRPAVAPRVATYSAITDGERCAWLFEPEDLDSLSRTLERAAGDRAGARARAAACREQVAGLSWEAMAERTAALLCPGLDHRPGCAPVPVADTP